MSDDRQRPERTGWLSFGIFSWELLKSALSVVRRPSESVIIPTLEAPLTSDRTHDCNEDAKEGVDFVARRRVGTAIVSFLFLATIGAGIAFQWVYWTDPHDIAMLGVTLALFLGCFGAGLVSHAHSLMIHKEATDPREVLPSPPELREETYATFSAVTFDVQRRRLLGWLVFAGLASAAAAVVAFFRSLGTPPGPVLFDTVWKRGQRLMTVDNRPMAVDSLQPGDMVVVFPEDQVGSEHAQTVLIRVDERLLRLPAERSDWAPAGYVAYSRVCTHAGCVVGLYEKTVDQLLCPCHQSTFDVLRAACPTGGPADRALPQLPLLAAADGTLRAAGGFSGPPGPGFWGIPS